tara:strand:- start:1052 stop:1300 length:249 start_codon:yes stop_codon:yes gene_type:complete
MEKRAEEIASLETEEARTHALKTHEWEDKIYDAISTVWNASIGLAEHGFTEYDSGYLIFALNKFKEEFDYVNDRDKKMKEDI